MQPLPFCTDTPPAAVPCGALTAAMAKCYPASYSLLEAITRWEGKQQLQPGHVKQGASFAMMAGNFCDGPTFKQSSVWQAALPAAAAATKDADTHSGQQNSPAACMLTLWSSVFKVARVAHDEGYHRLLLVMPAVGIAEAIGITLRQNHTSELLPTDSGNSSSPAAASQAAEAAAVDHQLSPAAARELQYALVLASRAVMWVGQLLQDDVSKEEQSSTAPHQEQTADCTVPAEGEDERLYGMLDCGPAWQTLLRAVDWLEQELALLQLPGNTGAEVQQQQVLLQQQCQELRDQLVHASQLIAQRECSQAVAADVVQPSPAQQEVAVASDSKVPADRDLVVALQQLAVPLVRLGRAICGALPLAVLCNNPDCSNLGGKSEHHTVSGKGCVCGGCRLARYCSKDCQAAHRKQHKRACKHLIQQQA